jgi:transposase
VSQEGEKTSFSEGVGINIVFGPKYRPLKKTRTKLNAISLVFLHLRKTKMWNSFPTIKSALTNIRQFWRNKVANNQRWASLIFSGVR